ncbi:MAG: hypothetical protein AAF657_23660, partial [Acidobacteriota bacterium]
FECGFGLDVDHAFGNRNAISFGIGQFQLDDDSAQGDIDIDFATVALRRYLRQYLSNRGRIHAGLGFGIYDDGSDEQFGLNLELGTELLVRGYKMRIDDPKVRITLDLNATLHRVDPEFDFVSLRAGFRLYFPDND